MLQRLIGMMWTRSGCAVSVNPRTKCLIARELRLTVASAGIQPTSISDRLGAPGCSGLRARRDGRPGLGEPLTEGAHAVADLDGRVEDVVDGHHASDLVAPERPET